MKHRGAKPLSLRTKLVALTLFIVFVLSGLCAYILISEYHSVRALSASLLTSETYDGFYNAFTRLQVSFNLYANSLNRTQLEDCRDMLEQMKVFAEKIQADFPEDANVASTVETVETYISLIGVLLDNSMTLPSPTFWQHVSESDALAQQITSGLGHINLLYLLRVSHASTQSLENWRVQLQVALVFFVCTLAALLLLLRRTIQGILSPVTRLAHYAQRISQGDFSYRFEMPCVRHEDELSQLSRTFVYMAETISHQMHELQDKIALTERLHTLEMQNISIKLTLAEKEMSLMQSMINPHFLFNCLGTISSMAILENAPNTQNISNKIARYLRSSMDLVGSYITLAEEIRLIKQYLYIQSLRFGDRIHCRINCDAECESAILPAMCLQPIVENAIIHGFKNRIQGGSIETMIRRAEDGRLDICIQDDGVGMCKEELERLRLEIREPYQSHHHCLGLHSVVSQLQIAFPGQVSFEIESTPEQGTQIVIRIPFNATLSKSPKP